MYKQILVAIFLVGFATSIEGRDNLVSIYKLDKANAEQRIATAGVLGKDQSENYVIYYSLEAYKFKLTINSIYLDFNKKFTVENIDSMVGKYVLVRGIYQDTSPRGLHAGLVSNVNEVTDLIHVKDVK